MQHTKKTSEELILSFLNKPVDPADRGLYSGKTGLLFLSAMSGPEAGKNHREWVNREMELMENTLPDLNPDFSFSEGLTGIGWAFQMMLKEGVLPMDKRYLPEWLDDLVYKEVVNNKCLNLTLFSEKTLLGKSLYFYQRVVNYETVTYDYYKYLANKECLILLTTEVYQALSFIFSNLQGLIAKRPAYLLEIGQSFCLLYLVFISGINKNYLQNALRDLRKAIETFLESNVAVTKENYVYLLYLIDIYAHIAFEMQEAGMIRHSVSSGRKYLSQIRGHIEEATDLELYYALCKKLNVTDFCPSGEVPGPESFYLWDLLPLIPGSNPVKKYIYRSFLLR